MPTPEWMFPVDSGCQRDKFRGGRVTGIAVKPWGLDTQCYTAVPETIFAKYCNIARSPEETLGYLGMAEAVAKAGRQPQRIQHHGSPVRSKQPLVYWIPK
jgi:hypothetical protein